MRPAACGPLAESQEAVLAQQGCLPVHPGGEGTGVSIDGPLER